MDNKWIELEGKVKENAFEIKLLDSRLTQLENNSIKLENTILKEGQETRRILEQVIAHTQNMEKTKFDLWVKVIGSGGIIYIIIEYVLKNVIK